ncbi:MAG TPA: hypothetical protein VHI93_08690 [Candidatus Thermoplasmatota archaeon]|nr:hypothetical protein [Candidatus Thermoplasmatota archaeon]
MRELTAAETEILAVLRLQYQDLGAESNAIKSARNNMVSIGSTLLVGGFLFGIKEQHTWLVAFIPFLFGGLLLHALQLLANSRALGGYRRYLEQQMNAILSPGRPTVFWEEVANHTMMRSAVAAALFFAALHVFITVTSAILSFRQLPAWLALAQVLCMVAVGVALWMSLRSAQAAYPHALQRAAASPQHAGEPSPALGQTGLARAVGHPTPPADGYLA